ncbi:hypothetical protein ILYODFUR_023572 [Ilyodon furcidens]|uniref:Uncharacterized protein n=1 Tax=Ilyodon furcidens TaxID=33524 RepID=A0ABV0SZR8_9TELE
MPSLNSLHPFSFSSCPDHLLSDTFPGQDCDSPDIGRLQNNNLPPHSNSLPITKTSQSHQPNPRTNQQSAPQVHILKAQVPLGVSKRRLCVERSLSTGEPPSDRGFEGRVALKLPSMYTITREGGMTLGGPGSEETVELEVLKVLKGPSEQPVPQSSSPAIYNLSCTSQPSVTAVCGSHHRSIHHGTSHHHTNQQQGGPSSSLQPLQSSRSASNIGDWGIKKGGSRKEYSPNCVACIRVPCQSQRSLDLDTSPQDGGKHRKKLERVYSEDRTSIEDRTSTNDREDSYNSWVPKENMFSFQTATTTMQA